MVVEDEGGHGRLEHEGVKALKAEAFRDSGSVEVQSGLADNAHKLSLQILEG